VTGVLVLCVREAVRDSWYEWVHRCLDRRNSGGDWLQDVFSCLSSNVMILVCKLMLLFMSAEVILVDGFCRWGVLLTGFPLCPCRSVRTPNCSISYFLRSLQPRICHCNWCFL